VFKDGKLFITDIDESLYTTSALGILNQDPYFFPLSLKGKELRN
jgi:hypothetical protein